MMVGENAMVRDKSVRNHRRGFILPRGLSRVEAADYIGVSPSKFDELVKDGRMPKALEIDARRVWDRSDLDDAFDTLKMQPENNPWDN
jgi:predicted DNA-binding transcriptional regulator AlpA